MAAWKNRNAFLVGLLNCCFPCAAHASFELSSWNMVTGVQDFSGQSIVQDLERLTVVENPLTHVSNTSVDLNTAETAYDLSWLLDDGTFHIDLDHHLETSEVRTKSSGFLLIEPDSDLRMTIDASLDYSSVPGDQASIRLLMSVIDLTTNDSLFNEFERGGNGSFEPASGTLAFAGDFTLPAGTTYRIDYSVDADTLVELDPAGPVDSGGFIHFELHPVPEPGTLPLLAVGLLAAQRKRR